ncbi:MAG: DUF2336 domain-containing protein [Xanthobacteraceae bacterium]
MNSTNDFFTTKTDNHAVKASATSHPSLLIELEEALSASSGNRQAEIAQQITSLFLGGQNLSDDQIGLFGQILERLIDKIETRALVELGERLAAAEHAPTAIMQRLAEHDEILVAGPVLSGYANLDDAHLVDITETKSQAHLLAITERNAIGEPVTDALVRRGDSAVALNLARNPGAKLSDFGFERLSDRAASDETLAESIALRADVPAHVFGQILVRASQSVQRRMIAVARADMHAEIKSVLDQVAGRLADELPVQHRYDAATRELLLAYPDGKIGEEDLLQFALNRKYDEVVAGLSLVSSLPVAKVAQLLDDSRPEPVLFLCKALGYSWLTARTVLQIRPAKRMSADALISASEGFGRLSRQNAQQIVGFWHNDQFANPPAGHARGSRLPDR